MRSDAFNLREVMLCFPNLAAMDYFKIYIIDR